jgi:hypothetical protein
MVKTVSEKERFLGTLLGEPVDRFPFFDLEPDEETLDRWHQEGLPRGRSVAEFFHLEVHHSVGLTLRSFPFYRKASDLLMDPSAFRRHYDPDDPSRYARGFAERARRLHREGRVVYVDASGGGLLQMLGVGDWASLKAACFALVEEPNRVEELVRKTTDFYCVCLERVLSDVRVDYATFYEPIASNTGPVVSPAMFKRYAMPGYRKVLGLLDRHGVPLRIFCTTGGNVASLLPPLIEAGINGLWISNIQSVGMDYAALRSRFGPGMALIGGIDARALSRNEAAVSRVLDKTVPPLLESGRYLPCLDDRPRSDMSFGLYRFYRERLEQMAGKG